MMAVSSNPTSIPRSGLEKTNSRFVNWGTSASGFTAPDIVSMPIKSTPKPTRIMAAFFFFSFLEKRAINTPIIAKIGAKEEGFKS